MSMILGISSGARDFFFVMRQLNLRDVVRRQNDNRYVLLL